MSELIAKIQEQLNKAEKAFSHHADALGKITSSIEALSSQKIKTTRALDMIQGARQAYQDLLALQVGDPLPLIKDGLELWEKISDDSKPDDGKPAAPIIPTNGES